MDSNPNTRHSRSPLSSPARSLSSLSLFLTIVASSSPDDRISPVPASAFSSSPRAPSFCCHCLSLCSRSLSSPPLLVFSWLLSEECSPELHRRNPKGKGHLLPSVGRPFEEKLVGAPLDCCRRLHR